MLLQLVMTSTKALNYKSQCPLRCWHVGCGLVPLSTYPWPFEHCLFQLFNSSLAILPLLIMRHGKRINNGWHLKSTKQCYLIITQRICFLIINAIIDVFLCFGGYFARSFTQNKHGVLLNLTLQGSFIKWALTF